MLKQVKLVFALPLVVLTACAENTGEPTLQSGDEGRSPDGLLLEELRARGLDGDPLGGRGLFGDGPWDSPVDQIQNDPVAQLGMQLFYTTHLSGQGDTACVSCHVNTLGGGDARPLPIGPSAAAPAVMGLDRNFAPGSRGKPVPRNAPTMFNAAAWDHCILMDCRVEALGGQALAGGDDGNGISTPFVGHGREDILAGRSLLAAHIPFPLNSEVVMRGLRLPELDTYEYGDCLAEKLAGDGPCAPMLEDVHGVAPADNPWPLAFAAAYDPTFDPANPPTVEEARQWVSFDTIVDALLTYEHTLSFAETPLSRFIAGDMEALSPEQIRGGLWFFRSVADGGADCASCHSGDLFSDERHHNVGLVQMGPGKAHGPLGDGDWGRGGITGNASERFQFRTPTLLNVTVTGPWGHHGAYDSLRGIVEAHLDPVASLAAFEFAGLQFNPAPENAQFNSEAAIRALQSAGGYPFVEAPPVVIDEVVAFMGALTDPCVESRTCLAPFDPFNAGIVDPNMDLLHPVDGDGCSLVEVTPTCDPARAGGAE